MKSTNLKRLEALEKKDSQVKNPIQKIILDPEYPSPELTGKGPFLMLPDNGHRFPLKYCES